MEPVLIDPYNRRITSLRVSITSRCNLNCFYCHNEGQDGQEHEMDASRVVNIINAAAGLGIKRVKFSGGEPLMRTDFEDILEALPELKNISATTNGTMLAGRADGLKAAGLDRVNISLDSLRPELYAMISGCKENMHKRVLDGVHAAVDAGLIPVKLNMVLLPGLNSGEVEDMISFVKNYKSKVILQLIEPMDPAKWSAGTGMDIVEKELQSMADRIVERKLHHRKKYYIKGAEVEVVRPMDNSRFCFGCSRLRVTADGKLKPCLLRNDNLVDISGACMDEMSHLFEKAVMNREPFFKGMTVTSSLGN